MKPEIQINQLRTLIAIEEEGSFSAASERVGRTQSAVTQQMQNLETIIGTSLFIAKGRRRELTEAGQILLRHAHEIISLCKQAVSASERSHNTGVVKLGAPLEIAEYVLPVALKQFARIWPGIRIVVQVDRSPKLMQLLENGLLDIVLSTRRSVNYESTLLSHATVHWIAGMGWRLTDGDPLPLVLTDEPSMFRRIALSALDLNGQAYVEKLTSSSMVGVRLAVEAGIGVTARTRTTFSSNVQILDTSAGLPPLPRVPYYLHRPHLDEGQHVSDLCEIIIERSASFL